MNDRDGKRALPQGWISVTLGDVAETQLGKTINPAEKGKDPQLPYLRSANVQWGCIDRSDISEMYFSDAERESLAIETGDLLVCEGGEAGRAAVWSGGDSRTLFFQNALHRVRPRADVVETAWLYHHFRFLDAVGILTERSRGNTIRHLSQRAVRGLPILLPPRPVQRCIARRLDEIEHHCTSAETNLQTARTGLEQLRGAVLAAACSGRLTEDWREDHPNTTSDQLHAELIKAGQTAKVRPAAAPDEHGLTSEVQLDLLPSSWSLVRLGDILKVSTGATPLRKNRAFYDDGTIPWVTSGAVNAGTITSPTELITPLALEETNVKLFPPGTLLVAMYGEGQTRGRVAELAIEAGTNQAVAAVLLTETTAPLRPFIRLFFEDSYRRVRALSVGGVQPNLNLGMIKDTLLPLPPREEQDEIVRRADVALETADRLTAQIEQAQETLDSISRASLVKAFRGELVTTEVALAAEGGRDF